MQDRLLTTRDVALMLGRSDQTIRRWIAEGIISAIKLEGRLLISQSEVERLIKEAMEE